MYSCPSCAKIFSKSYSLQHHIASTGHEDLSPITPPIPTELGQDPASHLTLYSRDVKWHKMIMNLFNSPRYSDITIEIGPECYSFLAHKFVLGCQSAYFDKAFASMLQESIEDRLSFKHYGAQAIWRVLRYLYTGTYTTDSSDVLSAEDDPELLRHVRVYAIADMLLIDDLKSLAAANLSKQLDNGWEVDAFSDCIREIYANTLSNSALRSIVLDLSDRHIKTLLEDSEFVETLSQVGDFSVDLIGVMAKNKPDNLP